MSSVVFAVERGLSAGLAERITKTKAILVIGALVATGFVLQNKDPAGPDNPGGEPSGSASSPAPPQEADASQHPFLAVKKSEYGSLRAKAKKAPYKDMKARAKDDCNNLDYLTTGPTEERSLRIRDLTGACSLMYILDPAKKSKYKQKIGEGLELWPELFSDVSGQYDKAKNKWPLVVPTSSGFFNSVLALDVVHDDLSAKELKEYETSLDTVAEWYWAKNRKWGTAQSGAKAIWAAYQGDNERLPGAAKQYHDQYLDWLSPDGPALEGPEYALARYGGERTAKANFAHIAEYTGIDANYYNDPTVQRFHEWLLSGAYGPFGNMVGFGDAGPAGRDINYFVPQTVLYTAGRFSKDAGGYAAYQLQHSRAPVPGDLLTYTEATDPAKPKRPASEVWPAGQMVAHENGGGTDALVGALWNMPVEGEARAHSHKDTNAVYAAGYGEVLLMNSGYAGAGKKALGFPYKYIHDTAESSNTVILEGQDHASKSGEGITENLLGDGLDYASGQGDAIFKGAAAHTRNFVFVHPQDGKNGYFINIDEVSGTKPGAKVGLVYHPASDAAKTIRADSEYQWNVRKRKATNTFLSIYLGEQPSDTTLQKGVIAGWDKSFVGSYLKADFTADSQGRAGFVSVLFPHDAEHTKAAFKHFEGAGFSGTTIKQGAAVDYALESDGSAAVNVGGASLTGSAAVYRRRKTATPFYFVRQGTSFDDHKGRGFSANKPVSIHMRGSVGSISSPTNSNVTISQPGVKSVSVDGDKVKAKTVKGGLLISVKAGQHTLQLQ